MQDCLHELVCYGLKIIHTAKESEVLIRRLTYLGWCISPLI